MICPKCGHENTGNFCSNCGALLRREGFPEMRQPAGMRGHETGEESASLTDTAANSAEHSDPLNASNTFGTRGRSRRREEPPENPENRDPAVRAPREKKENPKPVKSGGSKPEKSGKPDKRNERAERKAEKAGVKADKAEKKEMQLRDARINKQLKDAAEREKALSERLEQLDRERTGGERAGRGRIDPERAERERAERTDRGQMKRERLGSQSRREGREADAKVYSREGGSGLGEAAVKGAVSAIVLSARVMQIFCGVLMGYMVWTLAWSFWNHQEGLGLIQAAVDERNYGLILYVGLAGVSLFMGVIWCLWILSRKAAGGNVRLKTYDTGRGFLPFLICAAAVIAAGAVLPYLPSETAPYTSSFAEAIKGATAALKAVNDHRAVLISCSVIGAAVSFVRKLLRV